MITSLITFLIVAIVACIVFYVITMFIADGRIQKLIGLILGLIVLLYGLKLFYPAVL